MCVCNWTNEKQEPDEAGWGPLRLQGQLPASVQKDRHVGGFGGKYVEFVEAMSPDHFG